MRLIIPNQRYQSQYDSAFSNFKAREQTKNYQIIHSVYWLTHQNKFLGRVTIRYRLNRKFIKSGGHIGYAIAETERNKGYGTIILKLALIKAKDLGLKKVLLTCKENNLASKRVIEKNHGKFRNLVLAQPTDKHKTLRYWIDLSKI